MKKYIYSFLLIGSVSASPVSKEDEAKKAIACFDEVTTQISIGLSRAYHSAKPNSFAERRAKKKLDRLNDEVEGYLGVPTGCFESTETDDEKFECIIETYSAGTLRLAKKHKAMELVRTTPVCN